MTALPPAIAEAIERFGHACDVIGWSKPPMPEAARTHADLVAAISAALETARKAGIILERVERVPFTLEGDHD